MKAVKKPMYTPSKAAMELCEMLSWKRPDGSATERNFVKKYIEPLPGSIYDTYGNVHVVVEHPVTKMSNLVLFSCHTDTVHHSEGKQVVMVDSITHDAFIDGKGTKGKDAYGQCLGADDGTGVWLMMNMIRMKRPGYYIFHKAEEVGGRGSAFIRDNWIDLFCDQKFSYCIAFDRKGTTEVITHQSGTQCASDKGADQLIALFSAQGIKYAPSTRGSFTDSANYKYIVPECFNLGVGYDKQHGPNETQNLQFAERLLTALCKIDFSKLKAHRDHTKKPVNNYRMDMDGYTGYPMPKKKKKAPAPVVAGTDAVMQFVECYPLATIRLLRDLQVTDDDLLEYMESTNTNGYDLYEALKDTSIYM